MATTEFIAAIELGSSMVTGLAGRKNNDGSVHVLASAEEDASSFIRKGMIYNLDKTSQCLTSIIMKLEGELHNSISKVYVAVGGQSIRTVEHVVSRDLGETVIISQEQVDAICDENLGAEVADMDILDVAPQEYKIGSNLQVDPVGVAGNHLEGHFLNIMARATIRKNVEHCFEQAKIEIADLFVAPLVTANAVLTETERRSGCALVDFGADTTTISVYKGNLLRFLSVLPLGGNNITRDLTSLQIEEQEAEQLKITYGNALFEESEDAEPVLYTLQDGSRTIDTDAVCNIVEARAEEIIANVCHQLELSGYEDKLLAGVVLTGGASNLKNLDKVFAKKTKIDKIRVAKAPHFTLTGRGYKEDASLNTALGLLAQGTENCCLQEQYIQPAPTPQPEVVVEAPDPSKGFFNEDEELKSQEEIFRIQKRQRDEEEKRQRKEEKERKIAEQKAKEAEEKERKRAEKEARKGEESSIKKFFDKVSKGLFDDQPMD